MGSTMPKYEPSCEPAPNVDINKFPLQVAKIDILPGKSGWAKYKVSLPQSFRGLYYSDVLYGPDWRELLMDFDKKFLGFNKSSKSFDLPSLSWNLSSYQHIVYELCGVFSFHCPMSLLILPSISIFQCPISGLNRIWGLRCLHLTPCQKP